MMKIGAMLAALSLTAPVLADGAPAGDQKQVSSAKASTPPKKGAERGTTKTERDVAKTLNRPKLGDREGPTSPATDKSLEPDPWEAPAPRR